jgi:hypothetical protein
MNQEVKAEGVGAKLEDKGVTNKCHSNQKNADIF